MRHPGQLGKPLARGRLMSDLPCRQGEEASFVCPTILNGI